MLDIHSHIIPFIDDGSPSKEDSLRMLKDEVSNNVDKIILTPHFMYGVYDKKKDDILKGIETVNSLITDNNLPLKVYPGNEIAYTNQIDLISLLKKGEIFTLNNSENVLLEFNYTVAPRENILDILYHFNINGFRVIIAHVERYSWLKFNDIIDIKNSDNLIQVNASSASGKDGFFTSNYISKLIKNNLVDFIASDIHSFRTNYLSAAMNKYSKFSLLNHDIFNLK